MKRLLVNRLRYSTKQPNSVNNVPRKLLFSMKNPRNVSLARKKWHLINRVNNARKLSVKENNGSTKQSKSVSNAPKKLPFLMKNPTNVSLAQKKWHLINRANNVNKWNAKEINGLTKLKKIV